MSMCPKCGLNDRIQKVSSIVSQGRSTGYASSFDGAYSVMSTTDLAKRLLEPIEPAKPKGTDLFTLIVVVLVTLYGLVQLFPTVKSFLRYSLFDTLVVVALALFPLIVVLWLRARKIKKFENSMIMWEHAKQKWGRLYYCFRDDIVFDPENDGASRSPDTMQPWLYR